MLKKLSISKENKLEEKPIYFNGLHSPNIMDASSTKSAPPGRKPRRQLEWLNRLSS